MEFPWGNCQRYYSYSNYIRKFFSGYTQKISVDAGFTCPNRDGTKGIGGCLYCNNISFKPDYCSPQVSVRDQLKEGIKFFSRHKKPNQFLAYFQAYSNTYADIDRLEYLYIEALGVDGIKGLVISTRADCLEEEKLNLLESLARKNFVSLEIGVESCREETLAYLNRCCTFREAGKSIIRASQRGIEVGVHLILGLPGEDEETLLHHADILSQLPIDTLKVHQLQIIKNTQLAKLYKDQPDQFLLFSLDEYLDLIIRFLERLNPSIAVERFTNQTNFNMLVGPNWGLKNFEVAHLIERKLIENDTWQGRIFKNQIISRMTD